MAKVRLDAETEAMVLVARESLPAFMALVHTTDMPEVAGGWALPAQHQMEMCRALEDDGLGDTLIVEPRDAAKTTIAQGWVEWLIGRASLSGDREWANRLRLLYLRSSASLAYQVSNAIKLTIEGNAFYQAIFPKVRPHKDKWSEHEWKVAGNTQKDPTFQAAGIGSVPLGSRYDYGVFDDIADPENMATKNQRDKIKYTLTHAVFPMRVPGGRNVMLGTRWAWDDPPAWAQDWGWHTIYRKALIEHEDGTLESYYPERYPVEKLLEMRRADRYAFATQYQNEVAPEEGLIFERHWFKDRFSELPSGRLLRVDSWDTAFSEGRNRSYSVGLSAVVTDDWHVYIWAMFRGQVPYPALRDAVEMVARRNRSNAVIIEKKSSGHALVQDDRLRGLPIIEWQPFGQKGSPKRTEAAERISSMCAQGRVHLPDDYVARRIGDPVWLSDLERELFSYPESENDDVVDALVQMLYFVEDARLRNLGFVQKPPQPLRWAKPRHNRQLV